MITDRYSGRRYCGLEDVEAIWPPAIAQAAWEQTVAGGVAHYGLDDRGRRVAAPLGGHVMGLDDLIPAEQLPEVLRAAQGIAKKGRG